MLKPLQGKELGVVNLYFKILMHHISVYISQRIYVVSGSRLGLIASGDSFASITPFTGAIVEAEAITLTDEIAIRSERTDAPNDSVQTTVDMIVPFRRLLTIPIRFVGMWEPKNEPSYS